MRTARFEVLSQPEIERIHSASMEILGEIGISVDYGKAQELFREAGAEVDEKAGVVRIPESLVQQALQDAQDQAEVFANILKEARTRSTSQDTFEPD